MFNPLAFFSHFMRRGANPNQIIQNIVSQNPQARVLLNQIQQSGMSPQQFMKQYAKQNNIDLSPFANMINNNNNGAKR